MGMAYLALAAAAKKKQDQRRAASRRKHKREEEERKAREAEGGSYRSSKSSEHSYYDYVVYEIEHDEVLGSFFERLKSKMHAIRTEDGKDVRAKAEELDELVSKYEAERQKIIERLKESGIELRDPYFTSYYMGDFDSEKSERKMRGSINTPDSYDRKYTTYDSFNGVRLTTSMLEDDNIEALRMALEGTTSELEYNIKTRSEVKSKIEKTEKKKLISYDKRRILLKELNEQLRELDYKIRNGENKKKELELILSLTPEQKQDILKYKKASEEIRKAVDTIRCLAREFESKATPMDKKELILAAIQKLEEEGLTEEEIFTVFDRLDRVAIRRSRGEYEGVRRTYSRDEKLIKSFIKNIYEEDPTFVERNLEEIVPDVSDDSDDPDIDD